MTAPTKYKITPTAAATPMGQTNKPTIRPIAPRISM